MTSGAVSNVRQIFSVTHLLGSSGWGGRSGQRRLIQDYRIVCQGTSGKGMANGGQAAHVGNDGGQVLVGEHAQGPVRHEGMEGAAIMADALSNGTDEIFVGPVSSAGLGIGRDVGTDHAGGNGLGKFLRGDYLAGAFFLRRRLAIEMLEIILRVAAEAVRQAFNQVLAARHTFGRSFDMCQGVGGSAGRTGAGATCNEDQEY